MENINSGEQNPHNFIESIPHNANDGNHQPQDTMMSDFTSTVQVGQISANRQNQRMHIMSRQRRGYPATQDHTSYQRSQWRLSQQNRRRRINEIRTGSNFAQRRSNHRRRSQTSDNLPSENNYLVESSSRNADSSTNMVDNGVGVTMIRQICRTEPIPYHALTSNFEHGNSSRYQQATIYDPQGVQSKVECTSACCYHLCSLIGYLLIRGMPREFVYRLDHYIVGFVICLHLLSLAGSVLDLFWHLAGA